jgi:hypothetical protein
MNEKENNGNIECGEINFLSMSSRSGTPRST